MKKIKITLAISLIVFGIVASASNLDSIAFSNYCKIVTLDKNNFKLIYRGFSKQRIQVDIYNQLGENVYSKSENSDFLNKQYDLNPLGEGNYTVKVLSPGYLFQESIDVGGLSIDAFFDVKEFKQQRFSVRGNQDSLTDAQLYILDEEREVIYKDVYESKQIYKKYNLQAVDTDMVYFLIYKEGSLLSEHEFVMNDK